MADPLTQCPSYVLESSWTLDTLEALVPYEQVSEHSVNVPPIADSDDDFVEYLVSGKALTWQLGLQPDGEVPGWYRRSERDEEKRLRDIIQDIFARDNAGEIAAPVREAVRQLAEAAQDDMDEVDAIYAKWSEHWMWAKPSDDPFSCWALYKRPRGAANWGVCPLSLASGIQYIQTQVELPAVGDETRQAFETYDDLLEGDRGNWVIGDPGAADLMQAFHNARDRDREEIRDLFVHAYRTLWCAEYGIAQGESYEENKRIWQEKYGDLPKFKAPTPGPGPKRPDFGLPGGPKLLGKPIDWCRDFGFYCPPPKPKPEGEAVEPTMPDEPIPEPVEPRAWYQTTAGKVAIGVAGVTALAAGGYATVRYMRARA